MTIDHRKNKLRTPGYFIKRLKDNGFVTFRIFNKYNIADPRKWTVLVDPGGASVFIEVVVSRLLKNNVTQKEDSVFLK